jgi:hypothetical protein
MYGFNRHVWDVDPGYYVTQRKLVLIIETVFCFSAGLVKISILLFYRRLSSRAISTTFRWVTWITIGFIAAYSVAFILVPIFGCNPISAFWDQVDVVKVVEGYSYKCFNEGADVLAAGIISAVQDLATAILPTFLYWKLQLPIRQKLALFGIFAIGYGVVAVGAMRLYFSWRIFFDTYDETWIGWDNWLWSMLELHIGVMCANAPALKVFFKHFLQIENLTRRTKSRSHQNGSKPNSQQNTISSKSSKISKTFEKITSWKHSRSHSKSGYISEPHTDVSVDIYGGVRVQKEILIMHTPKLSRTTKFTSRFTESRNMPAQNSTVDADNDIDLDIDIEMGSWEAYHPGSNGHNDSDLDEEEEVQALPPMPSQPLPLASAMSRPGTPKPSLMLFSLESKTWTGRPRTRGS